MIVKIKENNINDIITIIRNAIVNMEAKGIYQWDDIYPNEEVLINDLNNGTLYGYIDEGAIKGIMVLNEYQEKEYETLDWSFNYGKHLIVHRLCINPSYQGKGIAKKLMNFAEQYAQESGYESIRLDAFTNNEAACNLYTGLGFREVGTVDFRKGKFYCFEKGIDVL
ncbi:MAG: GNAT family N-acetyltransferase [Bacillota bacterium]|nr:GNAT family N-acetyltransferase [Bacillota bacterium]